jgi:heme exporter protein B
MKGNWGVRHYLKAALAVAWKDLAVEWHSRELVSAMLIFALLLLFIFNFALELEPGSRPALAAGIIWVTLVFSGTLGLNRSISMEKDQGCLDGLLLVPIDRTAIYFGKVISIWFFMLLTAVIILPTYGILFNDSLLVRPGVFLVVALGSLGYSVVGTLFSVMASQTRTRDILLPILLFPVAIPLILAVVRASGGLLQGLPSTELRTWFNLLVVYDLVFLGVGFMAFEYLVED